MELLTPALHYLSSGACQENLLKTATGFEGICNRCRIVHVKKRRVFLVNTPLGGSSSSHWRLKTLQIINFSCFGQVHGVKVKIVKFDFILLLERQKLYDSRQNYWKHLASGCACEEEVLYVWSPICGDKDPRGFTMQSLLPRFLSGKRKTQDSETTGMTLTISKVPL